MGYIYLITNDINNKQYVGKTYTTVENRWKEHCRDYKKKQCENRPLYAAIKKYGLEHFHIQELEYVSQEISLEEREKYWINHYNTYYNGYNATLGGDGKHYLDYDLIIQTYKEVQNCKKVSEILKCSPDSVSKVLKDNNIKIISTQEQNKINLNKQVKQIDKTTGEIIYVFQSITQAAQYLGDMQKRRHIQECCINKRKSAYGYCWQFV